MPTAVSALFGDHGHPSLVKLTSFPKDDVSDAILTTAQSTVDRWPLEMSSCVVATEAGSARVGSQWMAPAPVGHVA